MLGSTYPKKICVDHILPKMKLDKIKEFYHKMNEIDINRSYKESQVQKYSLHIDSIKLEKIYKSALIAKVKLANQLAREINS